MTTHFVKTDTILDKILAHKVEENATCKLRKSLSEVIEEAENAAPPLDFASALRMENVALIAEVKKASPSKGVLVEDFDPVGIATTYTQNGAAAISVLTDEQFFQGNMRYLKAIRQAVNSPLLCKEFIIDPYQIYEGRAMGADAVLLIVAALEDLQMAELHATIQRLGMAALVEVHDEAELERALKIGATLVGVNNRNLHTFEVDLNITARIAKLVPPEIALVAESGISSGDDVRRMGDLGAYAVLVGEALVKSGAMAASVREFSQQKRVNRRDTEDAEGKP